MVKNVTDRKTAFHTMKAKRYKIVYENAAGVSEACVYSYTGCQVEGHGSGRKIFPAGLEDIVV